MMLHLSAVRRAVYYGLRWRLKNFLGISDRPGSPVVDSGDSFALSRHLRICRLLESNLELQNHIAKGTACEIGSGDCLAAAHFLLAKGFKKVYLVEKQAIMVDQRQKDLLDTLSGELSISSSLGTLRQNPSWEINADKVVQIREFFESATMPEPVDFIFSHDVVEHVEDLPGFFSKCASIIRPGGIMLHKFDLSGHEFFEDPMPPLDFQTYPNWLYYLMFPKYRRACRRFLDEIISAMINAGFEDPKVILLTTAERDYVEKLRPNLRAEAQERATDQLLPLDVVIVTKLRG